MGIFDSDDTLFLHLNCPQCNYSGELFGTVEEVVCPECGFAAVHVCLADEDSIRDGI
jgi:ribosomal protein S27E